MFTEWSFFLCLLSAPTIIHSEIAQHGNHSVSPRAADGVLEVLNQDLLHFLRLTVQVDVQQRMNKGSVDMQILADLLSDLGVSFRELDEAKVADLKAQLTAIGTGVESECSAGCALPSDFSDVVGLIEYKRTKEDEIKTAYDTSIAASTGKVVEIEHGLTTITALKTGFSTLGRVLHEQVPLLKTLKKQNEEKQRLDILKEVFSAVSKLSRLNDKVNTANTVVASLTPDDVKAGIEIINKFASLPEISDRLLREKSVFDGFKQSSAVYAAKIGKIKDLVEQNNPDQVMVALKTLEKLNVGTKFLNYFDNSFIKWEALEYFISVTNLASKLSNVTKVGVQLDPLRTSVENINSVETHQALLDIASLLGQFTNITPHLSESISKLSECVKDLDFAAYPFDISSSIDGMKNPDKHLKEYKESLANYLTKRADDWKYLEELQKEYKKSTAVMVERLKNDNKVTEFQETLQRLKTGSTSIKTADVNIWLSKVKIGKILADSRIWMRDVGILKTLKCLTDTNSFDVVKANIGVLPQIVNVGKGVESREAVSKLVKKIDTAVDLWKRLAAPPTRRGRTQVKSATSNILAPLLMSVRRLSRACTKDTLSTLLQGLPQLDPTVKTAFVKIIKSCQKLRKNAVHFKITHSEFKRERFTSILNKLLKPLSNMNIDAGQLYARLAPTTTDALVQQALQDLRLQDLKFVSFDETEIIALIDALESDFSEYDERLPGKIRPTTGEPVDWVSVMYYALVGTLVLGGIFLILLVSHEYLQCRAEKRKEQEEQKMAVKTEEDEKKDDKKGDKKKGKKDKKKKKKEKWNKAFREWTQMELD